MRTNCAKLLSSSLKFRRLRAQPSYAIRSRAGELHLNVIAGRPRGRAKRRRPSNGADDASAVALAKVEAIQAEVQRRITWSRWRSPRNDAICGSPAVRRGSYHCQQLM